MSMAERDFGIGKKVTDHSKELSQAFANFPKTLQEYREQTEHFNFIDDTFDAAELVTEAAEAYWAEKRLAWDAQKLDFYSEDESSAQAPHVIIMPGLGGWESVLDRIPSKFARRLPPWVPWGLRSCYDSTVKTLEKGGCQVTTVYPESGFNNGDFDNMVDLAAKAIIKADDSSDRPKVLLGHSMGAMAQSLLAARHPDLVKKVDRFDQVGGPLPLRVNSFVKRFFNGKNKDGGFGYAQEVIEYLSSRESDEMIAKSTVWLSEQDHIVTGITPIEPKIASSAHSALLHNQWILNDVMEVSVLK